MDERNRNNPDMLRELSDTEERIVRGEVHPNNQEAQLMRELLAQAKKALDFASGVIDLMEQKLPPEPEPEPELEPQPKKKKKSH